jgi:hypothetical protein
LIVLRGVTTVHPAFSRARLKSASLSARPLLARKSIVTSHRLLLALSLLACVTLGGAAHAQETSGLTRLAQTQPAQAPMPQTPAAPATAAPAQAASDEPI